MPVQSVMLACDLQHTRRAMTNVGIPADEQDAVFQLVATVLHLGNLEFTEAGEHDSSKVVESSADALEAAAKLLGVQADGLSRALTTRTRHTVDGNLPACASLASWGSATPDYTCLHVICLRQQPLVTLTDSHIAV